MRWPFWNLPNPTYQTHTVFDNTHMHFHSTSNFTWNFTTTCSIINTFYAHVCGILYIRVTREHSQILAWTHKSLILVCKPAAKRHFACKYYQTMIERKQITCWRPIFYTHISHFIKETYNMTVERKLILALAQIAPEKIAPIYHWPCNKTYTRLMK